MLLPFARVGDEGQQWLDCLRLGRVLLGSAGYFAMRTSGSSI